MANLVGILDSAAVATRCDVIARKLGKLTFDGVCAATAALLSMSKARVKLTKERMEKLGAPAASVRGWFAFANRIAPRVEDAVKARSSHDDAMVEIRGQLAKLMGGSLNKSGDPVGIGAWSDLDDYLKGRVKDDGALPATDAKAEAPTDETAEQGDMTEVPHHSNKVTADYVVEAVNRGDFTVEELTAIIAAISAKLSEGEPVAELAVAA